MREMEKGPTNAGPWKRCGSRNVALDGEGGYQCRETQEAHLSLSTDPIGLLDVVRILRRRWPILVGIPLAAAAATYFLWPSPPTTVTGTAFLATNQHPTAAIIDRAITTGNATGRVVTVQEDGVRVTVSTTAASDAEAKAALDAAMGQFTAAKVFEDERRLAVLASMERLRGELDILKGALGVLTSSPPTAGSGEYNPSTYAESVVPLSGKITELSEQLFTLEQGLDRPLAVSGNVTYHFAAQRSNSAAVMTLLAALASTFVTLLWLVALEALRRREAQSPS